MTGRNAAKALDAARIVCNFNDPRKPFSPSRLRLGTPAVTSRGMGDAEMRQIAAINPVLDNLKIASPQRESSYKTLSALKEQFLDQFPGGFHGREYQFAERNYKVEAHELAKKLLRRTHFEKALASKRFDELFENTRKVMQATNLVFPNEKMNFTDGLRKLPFQEEFCTTLYDLLFDEGDLKRRFLSFCRVLDEIGSAKWTVATYFPFIMYPGEHMFIKPIVTSRAAEVCAFELNYKPQLNWLTYEKLLLFSQYLRKELSDLKPRDMIDVSIIHMVHGRRAGVNICANAKRSERNRRPDPIRARLSAPAS